MEIVAAGFCVAWMLTVCVALYWWRRAFLYLEMHRKEHALVGVYIDDKAAMVKRHAEELKKARSEPTMDCRELLHDLTQGAALVKIIPISPLDIYIKRS